MTKTVNINHYTNLFHHTVVWEKKISFFSTDFGGFKHLQNFFNIVKKTSQAEESLISISASLKSDIFAVNPINVHATIAKITIKNTE